MELYEGMSVPRDKVVMFVRPRYDEVTSIVFEWAEEVIDYANKLGYEVIDIKVGEAFRKNVEDALISYDPKFFLHYGHGKGDALLGQDNDPIIDLKNISLLKGRMTFAVSCDSGRRLAYEIGKNGKSWFGGFRDKFLLPPPYVKPHHLLPFKDSVNAFPKAILEGKTPKEAYDETYATWTRWIERYDETMWRDYKNSVKILYEIENTTVPNEYEEIRKHFKSAYKLRVQSLLLQILNVEISKDEDVRKLLLHENPYLYASRVLREKGDREIKMAIKLLEEKKPPKAIKKLWTLKDLFKGK